MTTRKFSNAFTPVEEMNMNPCEKSALATYRHPHIDENGDLRNSYPPAVSYLRKMVIEDRENLYLGNRKEAMLKLLKI